MSETAGLVHRTVAARSGAAPHPAILLLHGRGSNELDLLGLAPELDPRLFVVSARAPYPWMKGYRWYDLEAPGRAEASTFRASLAQLTAFLDELLEAHPIDPAHLYLLGFSQGSMMSAALTLTVPDKVAGAILLSGFAPGLDPREVRAEAVSGKPIFLAHDTYDPVLDVELGRTVRELFTSLDADLTYREYPMAHQVIPEELYELSSWLSVQLDRPR